MPLKLVGSSRLCISMMRLTPSFSANAHFWSSGRNAATIKLSKRRRADVTDYRGKTYNNIHEDYQVKGLLTQYCTNRSPMSLTRHSSKFFMFCVWSITVTKVWSPRQTSTQVRKSIPCPYCSQPDLPDPVVLLLSMHNPGEC